MKPKVVKPPFKVNVIWNPAWSQSMVTVMVPEGTTLVQVEIIRCAEEKVDPIEAPSVCFDCKTKFEGMHFLCSNCRELQ